jgi:hypothetical protein
MKIHGFFGGVGSTIGQLWHDAPIFSFQVDVSSDYSLPNWVSGNPASPTLLDISGDVSLQSSTSRIIIGKFQESSTQFGEISILFMFFPWFFRFLVDVPFQSEANTPNTVRLQRPPPRWQLRHPVPMSGPQTRRRNTHQEIWDIKNTLVNWLL